MLHLRLDGLRKANHALKQEVEQLGGNPDDFPGLVYESDNDEESLMEEDESCESSSSQN